MSPPGGCIRVEEMVFLCMLDSRSSNVKTCVDPTDPTYIRCVLNDGRYEHFSWYVQLSKNTNFEQEFQMLYIARKLRISFG
ncbi:hypothetical protein BC938DRAFT_474278 [Jimgerdemannia flammicorona]|uniref:Uncharacterized protein n=1 Tax=Jimgerdemannia flammicorona TaxID=994334 RepID=A0A433QZJ6_9FUNG|nr:hypothetical protein BC938DRAFT_474278 [Jimgerdemannia flammicorona]